MHWKGKRKSFIPPWRERATPIQPESMIPPGMQGYPPSMLAVSQSSRKHFHPVTETNSYFSVHPAFLERTGMVKTLESTDLLSRSNRLQPTWN
jgi:hypothetical protein